MTTRSPFRIMLVFFAGMLLSVILGIAAAAILWYWVGLDEAQGFFYAYTNSYKIVFSFGVILGTALLVGWLQDDLPRLIDTDTFTGKQLSRTDYEYYKGRLESLRVTLFFTGEIAAVGFGIYYYAHFPGASLTENILLAIVATEYALGAYVGRKLIYTGMILHSLASMQLTRNIFAKRELDAVHWYVTAASTLTIIFVYLNVWGYYSGPYLFDRGIGESLRPFMLFPAVIATPVLLIFNFYPRAVVRRLYSLSLDIEMRNIRIKLKNEALTDYERRSYLIEFDKMSREELRYSLQLSLTDIPIGVTILAMVLQPLLKQ